MHQKLRDSAAVHCAGIAGAEKGTGAVAVYDLNTYKLIQVIGMPGIVTALHWSPKINQILVGTGDRTAGGTHVLYSPMMSERGALLCAGKALRAKNPYDFEPTPVIHTPGSLPMFRDERFSRKRGREKDAAVRLPPPSALLLDPKVLSVVFSMDAPTENTVKRSRAAERVAVRASGLPPLSSGRHACAENATAWAEAVPPVLSSGPCQTAFGQDDTAVLGVCSDLQVCGSSLPVLQPAPSCCLADWLPACRTLPRHGSQTRVLTLLGREAEAGSERPARRCSRHTSWPRVGCWLSRTSWTPVRPSCGTRAPRATCLSG